VRDEVVVKRPNPGNARQEQKAAVPRPELDTFAKLGAFRGGFSRAWRVAARHPRARRRRAESAAV